MTFASTFFPISAVGVVWKGRRVVGDARVGINEVRPGINEGRAGISEACAQVKWPVGWYQRGRCEYPPVVCRYQPAPGTCPLTSVQVSATSVHMADACAQIPTRAGHMSNDLRARISDLGACGSDLRAGIRDLRAQVR